MSSVPAWHHAATDNARGRSHWAIRDGVADEQTLLLNPDAATDPELRVPMLHTVGCGSMTRKDLDRDRIVTVPGVLFPALYRSEQSAYLTGAPRVVAFCVKCITRNDA
jgi:hypothetical protein